MKKVLSVILALTLIVTLFGCMGTVNAVEDPNGGYLVAKRNRPMLIGNGDAPGDDIGSGTARVEDLGWRPGSTEAYWVVGDSCEPNSDEILSMHLVADVAEGQGPYNATPRATIVPYMDIDPQIGAFMLYIESPTAAANTNFILRFDTFWATQNGKNAWGRFYNMKFKYLAVDGKDWITGRTDTQENILLPSGFKGYVKFYMNDCTQDAAGNQSLYAHLANDYGFNMSQTFNLASMDFIFGSLGGEYGDFVVGGMYSIDVDTDNTYGCLYDWYNADSSTPNRMTNYEPILSASRSGSAQYAGGNYSIGDTVNNGNLISITDMGWRSGKTQATLKIGPAAEPETDNYSIVIHSDVAEGQGPDNASPCINFRSYLTVNPTTNALMFYMETPTLDESSNINYILRLNTCWCSLNGANKWGHLYNMKIKYLADDSNEWVESSTDWNETLLLPSGFKGYVKFYLDTAMQSDSVSFYQHIGYTNPSSQSLVFNSFDMVFGWLGGEYGDLVLGGAYTLSDDCDTIEGILSKNGANPERVMLTNYQNENDRRLNTIVETYTEIGTQPSIADGEAIQAAKYAYYQLPEAYKSRVSSDVLDLMASVEQAYDVYRPAFLGSTVKDNFYGDDQSLRIVATVDPTAAAAEGYTPVKYGTVILAKRYLANNWLFDDTQSGASGYELNAISNGKWSVQFDTNDMDAFYTEWYARAYVVYQKGEEQITVWNAERTDTDGESKFFLRTSLIETANALGTSVLHGSAYGDVNGDGDINADDLTAMRQDLLGIKVNPSRFIVDVTDDDTVNIQDLIRFKKYVAGKEVSITPTLYSNFSIL